MFEALAWPLHSEALFFGSHSEGGDDSAGQLSDPVSQGCKGVAQENRAAPEGGR